MYLMLFSSKHHVILYVASVTITQYYFHHSADNETTFVILCIFFEHDAINTYTAANKYHRYTCVASVMLACCVSYNRTCKLCQYA